MEERLKIAVFIDFDNIEIGVKTTLNVAFDVGTILEAIKERGEVVTKIAYGDWTRAGDYSRLLTQHAIKMVQRNLTPGGDKNGADINLALDALEMAFTHDHINAYVIVGGDSDFISLVEKLKQYDKTVFVVGGRAFTSVILQRNCHEFIAYENLINVGGGRRQPERGRHVGRHAVGERRVPARAARAEGALRARGLAAARAAQEHAAAARLHLLGEELRRRVVPRLRREAGAGGPHPPEPVGPQPAGRDQGRRHRGGGAGRARSSRRPTAITRTRPPPGRGRRGQPQPQVPPPSPPRPQPTDEHEPVEDRQPVEVRRAPLPAHVPAPGEALAVQQGEAIALLRRVIEQAAKPLRWPMYVRNVKQLLRAADSSFDERRYGFGGILDLLRASQRDALLRLERDRQGVLRVFPGAALQRPAAAPPVQEATIEEPGGRDCPARCQATNGARRDGGRARRTGNGANASPRRRRVIDAETIETPVAEAVPEDRRRPRAVEAKPKRRRAAAGGARKAAAARKPRGLPPRPRERRGSERAPPGRLRSRQAPATTGSGRPF